MRTLVTLLALSSAAAAAPCRALLNFETADPGAGRYVVMDVGPARVQRFRGLAVGAGAQLAHLDVVQNATNGPRVEDRFEVLQTVSSPHAVWYGGHGGIEGEPESDGIAWDHESTIQVTGVFGPYISLAIEAGGYLGGAHGTDDPAQITLKGGQPVDVAALIGPSALRAAKAAIAAEAKTRGGWADGPDPKQLTLKRAALSAVPSGLRLQKSLFCCTWAENHNRWELDVSVKVPEVLVPILPAADGWRSGPATCDLRVRVAEDQIMLRSAGKVQRVGAAPGRLLGVAWVDASAPALTRRASDPAQAAALVKASRGKMSDRHRQVVLEAARHADFDNAEVLAEAGWVAFKRTELDRAARYTSRALEFATDPALGARIRYNLGRIHEARGDLARALGLYAASVAQRPNATVSKRMKTVEAALQK